MIEPFQSDQTLLGDIESVASASSRLDTSRLHIWWLGQSTFLCKCQGLTILFDPYLSDALTEKYKNTAKPHVRISRRVVDPGALAGIDVVTCTHAHTDHLDAQTLNPLFAENPHAKFIYPRAIDATVRERVNLLPARSIAVNAGESASLNGVSFYAIASAHDTLETDSDGNHTCLGYVARLARFRIYHSGDGVVYPGLVDALRAHQIDVAILPINGKVGNMNGADAARLAHDIGAKCVIPCHYDLFAFNTADARELFIPECQRLKQPYRVLRLGERLTVEVPS